MIQEGDRGKIKLGQELLCRYWEDKKWYNAVIDKIAPDGTFLVTFTEYFNQEKVTLADMKIRTEGKELLRSPLTIGDMVGKVEIKLTGKRMVQKKASTSTKATSKLQLRSEIEIAKLKVS